jgi:HK97 family phage prohead protease
MDFTRAAVLELGERKASSEGLPTFSAVFSTETPVRRRDYTGEYDEILSHKPGAIDLSRAPLPLIESHDRSQVNVGKVTNLLLDGARLRADVVLGKSARARELTQDIEAGIVTGLSVAYQINEWDTAEGEQRTATHWTPFEVSIVSVPADINAGIGRSKPVEPQNNSNNVSEQ